MPRDCGPLLQHPPPAPAELSHLRPHDGQGAARLALCLALTIAGAWLSLQPGIARWLAGQMAMAAAMLQWFVLLHECGHETLFRSRRWHRVVGPIAGALSFIPFAAWRRVHGRHHKWTGWQDLDPTAASLTPRRRSRFEHVVVNLCWRLWIPLFSCVYRIANYWNVARLARLFPEPRARRGLRVSMALLAATYALAIALAGAGTCLRLFGLAAVLSFAAEDVLLLSHGAPVRPYASRDQEVFTRSLRLPAWMSAWLLHFDAHELHHMYPFVPGYHLRDIAYQPAHEIGWLEWLWRAKQLPGDVLLFQNRNESGWDL